MKTLGTIICLSVSILALPVAVDAQSWRKIVPLSSTRVEVEQLLGENEKSLAVIYELQDGNLFIEYSSGPCRPSRRGGWNVPKDTVISFSFSPKRKQRLKDLKLDSKEFRKKVDKHTLGITYYINEQEGIMYEVQRGRIEILSYFPPARYDHMHCGDPSDPSGVPQQSTPQL